MHRVQRVPATESQGRIHTSAAGVLVLPEAEDVEIEIDPNDLRIDVFRSSGPGGQSVNTTDSAVRITHMPDRHRGVMQNEKSQLQNREAGHAGAAGPAAGPAQEQADAAASDARRCQVRTVDRSERVRTYNFPENRISDHRVGFKAYNLDQVLDGALDDVIDALADAEMAEQLGDDAAPGVRRTGVETAERPGAAAGRVALADGRLAEAGAIARASTPSCSRPMCTASSRRTAPGRRRRRRRAVPRERGPPCGPRAAAAHHRLRLFRHLLLERGSGGVRSSAGNRGHDGWAIDRLREMDWPSRSSSICVPERAHGPGDRRGGAGYPRGRRRAIRWRCGGRRATSSGSRRPRRYTKDG